MSKQPFYQASFSQNKENTLSFLPNRPENASQSYPNFTLVDPRLTHLFKSMCQNFKDQVNQTPNQSPAREPLIIDNQTGRIITEIPKTALNLKKETPRSVRILQKARPIRLNVRAEKS